MNKYKVGDMVKLDCLVQLAGKTGKIVDIEGEDRYYVKDETGNIRCHPPQCIVCKIGNKTNEVCDE